MIHPDSDPNEDKGFPVITASLAEGQAWPRTKTPHLCDGRRPRVARSHGLLIHTVAGEQETVTPPLGSRFSLPEQPAGSACNSA